MIEISLIICFSCAAWSQFFFLKKKRGERVKLIAKHVIDKEQKKEEM